MQATIEISMYALTDDYVRRVSEFILRVKQNKNVRVEVNGLSTQIFGEYGLMMDLLRDEMKKDLELGSTVFLMKIGPGELTYEKLPENLK